MTAGRSFGPTRVFPAMWYRDAQGMIDWLCRAFGFEKHLVVPGEDGGIAHAELAFGDGMIMMGSYRDKGVYGMVHPHDAGGVTQSVYLVVDDTDAVYARAKAAGAEIVQELTDTDYGSRDFAARDPEGHLWHFGTYQPYAHGDGQS